MFFFVEPTGIPRRLYGWPWPLCLLLCGGELHALSLGWQWWGGYLFLEPPHTCSLFDSRYNPDTRVAPLFFLSFCFAFLLSAKPPPAKDWCAWMIYGGDCQGLLKPIQFQDSGSHFLSLTAHLMNSHYQLTCFIIVKALIEVVFKKNMEGKKMKFLSPHFFFLSVPRAALPEVHSPIN